MQNQRAENEKQVPMIDIRTLTPEERSNIVDRYDSLVQKFTNESGPYGPIYHMPTAWEKLGQRILGYNAILDDPDRPSDVLENDAMWIIEKPKDF